MTPIQAALMRSLCYTDTIEYAPTISEWIAWLELGSETSSVSYEEVLKTVEKCISSGQVILSRGRVILPGQDRLIALREARAGLMPRK